MSRHTIGDHLDEAISLKQQGKHKEAIQILRTLRDDIEPDVCVELLEELADNLISLNNILEAITCAKEAIECEPQAFNAQYLLGFSYSRIGSFELSLKYLEESNRLCPNHPEILRCLGWSMYFYGRKAEGLILMRRAYTLSPTDYLIIMDLAVLYAKEQNYKKAMFYALKAHLQNPEDKKAKEWVATLRTILSQGKNAELIISDFDNPL